MIKLSASVLAVFMFVLAGCGGGAMDFGAGTPGCPQADQADLTAITQERADMLIGLTESDAESCAKSLGWAFRVGERDGESFAVTADYSQQRVTVSVAKNLVTTVAVG